ncbi:Lsr2-like DNA bridging protein [Streptomyces phage Yosif]|uniref:Lsr2-like DNA bridging protein n=1 Tax=Streptomyces phage Yosif TaxID=2201421 RepID=A0A2Z4QDH0_9CAUD|nr:nucloid associated Lsr2-like [Streptomyces phage Yosif]AWY07615.1 Lsr2-like DNA bridging protein [Streptomyces phage Yosif]
MAMKQKRTVIDLLDDLDGSPDATTVSFGLDGKTYEIELGEKNEAKLRKFLEKYVEAGRPQRASRKRSTTKSKGPKPADVRAWAAENGIEVGANGRVPRAVTEQYLAAKG